MARAADGSEKEELSKFEKFKSALEAEYPAEKQQEPYEINAVDKLLQNLLANQKNPHTARLISDISQIQVRNQKNVEKIWELLSELPDG